LYIPPGFAHGYLTLAEDTDLVYLTSRRYEPDAATGLRYDDPDLGIVWPAAPVRLSQQDRTWPFVADRSDL
jgi:dTDP-4-dehydrorhamnose 3,5-epimerase